MRKSAILLVLAGCFVLLGCCEDDDHKGINRCLAQTDAEVHKLKARIKELEWKVETLRLYRQQEFDEKMKQAEEWHKEKNG